MSDRSTAIEVVRPTDMVTSNARRDEMERLGHWNDDTLSARVAKHASKKPDSCAVVDSVGKREFSYAQLDADASRLANFLIAAGIKPGDVVSVQMPSWYETVVIDLGVMRAGAVMNPLLPNYRGKELRHMLTVGGVKVLFTPERYRRFDHRQLADEVLAELDCLERTVCVSDPEADPARFRDWLEQYPATAPEQEVSARSVSELIFTSGTEAQPKAIMHTEQTTNFSARAVASSLGLDDSDVIWMPSPIGHSTGFNYGVRVALYLGLPLVLQDQWRVADAVSLIERQRCSYSVVATTFVSDVCSYAEDHTCDLSSMRLFGSGGSPIPPEVVASAKRLGMNVLRLYGSTEVLMATTNRPGDPESKLIDTDGRALDDVEIEVRNADDHAVIGEPGEILIRGPNTCVGFYNDPVRTADTFEPDGWVRSGDLGTLDVDGFLAIVGRKKEIIIRGGLNIAPREIEELVSHHPAVADVAVVGVPHQRLGEMTCAAVVLEDGHTLDLDALVAFLTDEGMATFKLPQKLVVCDQLPRTTTGKVQKFAIAERLEQGP
jgi:acyl-coenzyme A synthetase/AMP-(fatty) acid ligase